MLITIGEGENRIVRDTEYEIGDYVTVYEHGRAQLKEMDTTMYRPKWRDIPMLKDTDLPCYPIEVNTRYKITDITISAATGHITYHLNYSNPRVVFPSGSRSAEEMKFVQRCLTMIMKTIRQLLLHKGMNLLKN